jgi:hypothetical protein
MRAVGRLALCVLALAAGSITALAQSAISARSGMIHYVEGQVYLDGEAVENQLGHFPEVKENGQLRTAEGRAEVLLTPGVFFRLGENSSFRMITNRLIDTRLEFLSGTAIVEAADIPKDNSVTVVYQEATIHIEKKGIYRFDSTPAQLRVFDGLAEVTQGDKTVDVKEGHEIALDTLAVSRFDKNDTDALNRWSERRAEYVAMANVSAANSLRTSDYGAGGYVNGGWYWNPFFGMYTFVPGLLGSWYSPYGYRFWSPYDVYMAYLPGYYYYPGYYAPTYAGAYNSGGARTVPAPGRSSGSGGSGSASLGHSGFGSSARGSGSVSAGSVSSGTVSAAPVSHGSVGGGSPHH